MGNLGQFFFDVLIFLLFMEKIIASWSEKSLEVTTHLKKMLIVRKTRRLWNTSEETPHVWHKAPLRTWSTIPRRSTLANSCHRTVLNIPLFAQAAWNSQRKDNRDNKWKEFSVQVRMSNACHLINACLFSTERPSLQYPSITPHICRSKCLGWFILENKSPPILLLSQLLMYIHHFILR